MLAALSLLPIISVAVFLVMLRWPASRAMPISYLVALGLALLVWQVPFIKVMAASLNGLIDAIELIYIIFVSAIDRNLFSDSGRGRARCGMDDFFGGGYCFYWGRFT